MFFTLNFLLSWIQADVTDDLTEEEVEACVDRYDGFKKQVSKLREKCQDLTLNKAVKLSGHHVKLLCSRL